MGDLMVDDSGGYDALLLVAFGGPESIDDVAPFLARVTAGRPIPPERLAQVADRYLSVGGRSPLNARLRTLQVTVAKRLVDRGVDTSVFWGNRNAAPLLVDTIAEMRDAGVRRAMAWVASPYASYSTCRQYTENIETARTAVGPDAPVVDRIGGHHDHPGLIGPAADRLVEALDRLPAERRDRAHLLFSAHSIPSTMAADCDYVAQLHEVARLVAQRVDPAGRHDRELVWQSRSGPPHIPWLEPDVGDRIDALAAAGVDAVVVSPIGFPVENFEIVWDLDVEAAGRAERAGVAFQRASTIDDDPRFVDMIVNLFLGHDPASARTCRADCCPPLPR
jgi:ferrochelatase